MGKKRKKGKKAARQVVPVASLEAERAYEAAMSTPARRHVLGADQSQDSAANDALPRIRDWGRYLDENHDLASGVLDELVKNIVGSGIITVPKPLNADGSVDEGLGVAIMRAWNRWRRAADVSGELSWHDAQRIICRSWMRDGEEFLQHVQGRQRSYPFTPDETPYRVELLESDLVPWDLTNDTWRQGIQHDTWKRPLNYAVYLEHPGNTNLPAFLRPPSPFDSDSFKTVPAQQVTHIKVAKRWPATRGISLFSTVISRLYDVKDLEESERIKDRILASWAAAIIKSPDLVGHENTDTSGRRFIDMFAGTMIDTLAPGETIQGVGPDYPVADMPDHIADQIRRIASGTGTRYSSIAKRYDGNYAAQRQEMVESEGHYKMRGDTFVEKICRPVYERWLITAFLDGQLPIPGTFDLERAANAEYRGPVTPWIDPLKEVQADKIAEEQGYLTLEQIQIKRGASPESIGQKPARSPVQLALIEDEENAA